jgi:hypothetical protein
MKLYYNKSAFLFLTLFVLICIALPICCSGQPQASTMEQPIIDCASKRVHISDTSFVRQQVVLDSIAKQLVGCWQLTVISRHPVAPYTPNWSAELRINQQKQAEIYVNDKWETTCQLTLSLRWGYFYFDTSDPKGRSFFHLSSRGVGGFRLCGQNLFIHNNHDDGYAFLLKRINKN